MPPTGNPGKRWGRRESELRRIKVALAAAAVIAATMALASPAAAVTGALDQYQNGLGTFPLWGSDYSLAQTFTSGYLRPLTAVGIYATPWGPTSASGSAAKGSATLQIVPVYNGLPNTEFPLLTENVIIPTSDGGQWVYFNFPSPPLVDLHGQYAIVVTVHAPWGMEWLGSCSASAYKFGQAAVKGPTDPYWLTVAQWNTVHHTSYCLADFSFRTYVGAAATPVPTVTHTATPTPAHTAVPTAARTAAPTATTGPGAVPPPPPAPLTSATDSVAATGSTTASAESQLAAGGTPSGPLAAAVAGATASGSPGSSGSSSGGGSSSGISYAAVLAALAATGGAGAAFFFWRFRLRQ